MYRKVPEECWKLRGYLADRTRANNRQGNDVLYFATKGGEYAFVFHHEMIYKRKDGKPRMHPTSELVLKSNCKNDFGFNEILRRDPKRPKTFIGKINGRDVRVILNKVSGELQFLIEKPLPDWVVERFIKENDLQNYYC